MGLTSFWPLFQFRKQVQHQVLAFYSFWFEINQSFLIVLVSGNPSKGLQWTSQDEGGTWWESRQRTRSTISSGTDFSNLKSANLSEFECSREFLETVPDVIFFQDCIQEEDITTVLKEVSHDRYKIHFQVRVRIFSTVIIHLPKGGSWKDRKGKRKSKRTWGWRRGRISASATVHGDCLDFRQIFWDAASGVFEVKES